MAQAASRPTLGALHGGSFVRYKRHARRLCLRCAAAGGVAGDAVAAELRTAVAAAYATRRGGTDALLSLRRSADVQRMLATARAAADADALSHGGLANALWAAGALASGGGGLDCDLDALSAAFARSALSAPPPPTAAADAAWALAVSRHWSPAVFDALAGCASRGDFRERVPPPRAAATLLWASAVLSPPAARHGQALAAALLPLHRGGLATWRAQHLALALWALSADDAAASPHFAAAWAAVAAAPDAAQLSPLALSQLAQAALSAAQAGDAAALPPLPPLLARAAAGAWAARVDGGTRRAVAPPSALQAAVGRSLAVALGRRGAVVPEARVFGGYRVDWAVPPAAPGGPATAVEVDGAAHFARNAPPLPALAARTAPPPHALGATRLKRMHLARGAPQQPLAVVTHWEWEEARLKDATSDFLRTRVAQAEAAFMARVNSNT